MKCVRNDYWNLLIEKTFRKCISAGASGIRAGRLAEGSGGSIHIVPVYRPSPRNDGQRNVSKNNTGFIPRNPHGQKEKCFMPAILFGASCREIQKHLEKRWDRIPIHLSSAEYFLTIFSALVVKKKFDCLKSTILLMFWVFLYKGN